jgi:hypothetical protein
LLPQSLQQRGGQLMQDLESARPFIAPVVRNGPCGNRPRGLLSEALVTHLIRSGRDFQPTRVTTKLGWRQRGTLRMSTAQELKPEAALEALQ